MLSILRRSYNAVILRSFLIGPPFAFFRLLITMSISVSQLLSYGLLYILHLIPCPTPPCLPHGMLLCPTYYIKHLFVQSFSPSLLLKALLSPSSYSKRLECFHFEIKWTSREKGSVHIRTEFKVGSCLYAGKCTVQKRGANESNRIIHKW